MLFYQQQKTAFCLTRSVSLKLIYSCLFPVSSLSDCTTTVHRPPRPHLQLWHEYTNQLLRGPSCAFSRCFTTAPCMTPAVRFDNAEHLPLSPSAMNKRGDLSPPFICNVTSMYSLLVTELEKMVGPTVWENPWGFSGDQGTLSWQLEPKKTGFSSRCQSWAFWIVSPEGWEEIHIWFNWDWRPSGFPEFYSASSARAHTRTHGETHRGDTKEAQIQKCCTNSMRTQGFYVRFRLLCCVAAGKTWPSGWRWEGKKRSNWQRKPKEREGEIPFKLKGRISSPHTGKCTTRGRQKRNIICLVLGFSDGAGLC